MRISKLIPEHNKLVSKGTVAIWVNNENGETPIELPITSEGVLELRDELIMRKPSPPRRALVVKADSDIGRELGLTEDTVKLVIDEADEQYLKRSNEYSIEFMWQIILKGLDMEFTDKKGKALHNSEDKKAVLLLNGLTLAHLETLFNAILKLGEAKEEELEEFIQRTTGFTNAVQRKIVSRSKKTKQTKSEPLYNETILMSEYGIDPEAWEELHSADKRVLNYSLLLKYHKEAEMVEEQERARKLEENKQKLMNSGTLPTFSGGGGRI